MLPKASQTLILVSLALLVFLFSFLIWPQNLIPPAQITQILIIFITLFICFLLVINLIFSRQLILTKSPLGWPIMFFVFISGLATFFSTDSYLSLIGWQSQTNLNFVLIISFTLLYFFIIPVFKDISQIRKIIWSLLVSLLVISLLVILQSLPIFIPFFTMNPFNFSYLELSKLIAVIFPLAVAFSIHTFLQKKEKNGSIIQIIFAIILVLASVTSLFFSDASWQHTLVAASGLVFLFGASKIYTIPYPKLSQGIIFITLIGLVLTITPKIISPQLAIFSQPHKLSLSDSLQLTKASLVHQPTLTHFLFGHGPETFYLVYPQIMPASFNLSPALSMSLPENNNQFLQTIIDLGIIGLASYLLIIIVALRLSFSYFKNMPSNPNNFLLLGIIASLISFFVSNFLFVSNLPLFTLFFILLILLLAYLKASGVNTVNSFSPTLIKSIALPVFTISLLVVFVLSFLFGRYFLAEWYFAQGVALMRNQTQDAYNNQMKAIQLNPYDPSFHLIFSITNSVLAENLLQNNNTNPNNAVTVQKLFSQSINELKATLTLSPKDGQTWETLGDLYVYLGQITPEANQFALSAYQRATQLQPTNAVVFDKIGQLYFRQNNLSSAEKNFKTAILLKNNFSAAHFHLGLVFKGNKMFDQAKIELQEAQKTAQNESDKLFLEEEIKKLTP